MLVCVLQCIATYYQLFTSSQLYLSHRNPQCFKSLNLEIQSMLLTVAGICTIGEEHGIFQTNTFDCNERGDLTVLYLFQSTAKQDGKKSTTLPFIPDNPDRRIPELLLDTTVVHPLPGPNSKHKLTLIEAKQNLRAAGARKKKYDVICAQNGLKFLPIIFESTGKCIHFFKIFSQSLWIP